MEYIIKNNVVIEGNLQEVKVSYKQPRKGKKFNSSLSVVDHIRNLYDKDTIEYKESALVVLMDRQNKVIGYHTLSTGGTTGTVVDIKSLFSLLLKANAQAFIITHNHPSGHLQPSNSDDKLTKNIFDASRILDITFLDHLIITKDGYYSYADDCNIINN